MQSKVFKIGNQEIVVKVALDEVIDYNDEFGFEVGDEECRASWIGLNTSVEIGNASGVGQVQWDNNPAAPCAEWSLSCDGNPFADEVLRMLRSNFDEELLFDDIGCSTDLDIEIQEIHTEVCDFIAEVASADIDTDDF